MQSLGTSFQGYNEQTKNMDSELKEKAAEIEALRKTIASLQRENRGMSEKIGALQKKRAENDCIVECLRYYVQTNEEDIRNAIAKGTATKDNQNFLQRVVDHLRCMANGDTLFIPGPCTAVVANLDRLALSGGVQVEAHDSQFQDSHKFRAGQTIETLKEFISLVRAYVDHHGILDGSNFENKAVTALHITEQEIDEVPETSEKAKKNEKEKPVKVHKTSKQADEKVSEVPEPPKKDKKRQKPEVPETSEKAEKNEKDKPVKVHKTSKQADEKVSEVPEPPEKDRKGKKPEVPEPPKKDKKEKKPEVPENPKKDKKKKKGHESEEDDNSGSDGSSSDESSSDESSSCSSDSGESSSEDDSEDENDSEKKKMSKKTRKARREAKEAEEKAESNAKKAMKAAKKAKSEWNTAHAAYLLAIEKKKSAEKIEKAKKERDDAKINANNAVEAANKAKRKWVTAKDAYEATTAKSMRVNEAQMPGGQEGSDEETAKGSKGKKRTPADSGIVQVDEGKPKKAKKSK
jgi:hypothetical protein